MTDNGPDDPPSCHRCGHDAHNEAIDDTDPFAGCLKPDCLCGHNHRCARCQHRRDRHTQGGAGHCFSVSCPCERYTSRPPQEGLSDWEWDGHRSVQVVCGMGSCGHPRSSHVGVKHDGRCINGELADTAECRCQRFVPMTKEAV